jgi:sucrose-6-phosphate hydrolase SacC (GH32 family)
MSEKLYDELYRPQFHFSSRKNWINDPNGLVYYDGEYHLFFQHNPDGLQWGNMTWGHAVSPDLLHWTQLDHALYPDSWGTMFSGSAVVDWNNTAGFQSGKEKTLVAIYTLHRSADVDSSLEDQCIAYSNDRGRTWTKYAGNPVIPTPHLVNRGFRDPKVFWHAPTNKWVMIIYHRVGNQLYGSPDLKTWKLLSEFTGLPHECPDMYELPVDGNPADTRWVTEGGNGDFFIGRFDGTTFTPESEKLTCDYGSHYYASQTFSDVPACGMGVLPVSGTGILPVSECSTGILPVSSPFPAVSSVGQKQQQQQQRHGQDAHATHGQDARATRRIQIAWMAGHYPNMPFNGQMSFPRELTLVTTPQGIRMVRRPVREIETIRGREWKFENLTLKPGEDPLAGIEGELLEIQARIEVGSAAKVGLQLRDESIRYSAADHRLRCLAKSAPLEVKGGVLDLRILLDRTTIEIFADGGLVTMASCFLPEPNDRSLELYAKGGEAKIVSLNIWELNSTWK